MNARCAQEGTRRTHIICRMHVFCTYIIWCQLTHLHTCWWHLWHVYKNVRPFRDMIVQMSEYSLMAKHLLVQCRTLILYDIIDGRYVQMGNLSCMSLLLLSYVLQANKKKVYKYFRSHKARTNITAQKPRKKQYPICF